MTAGAAMTQRAAALRTRYRAKPVILALVLATALLTATVAGVAAVLIRQPYPESPVPEPAATTAFGADGQVLLCITSSSRCWHLPAQRPHANPDLEHAVVAIEDQRFFSHGGVDWQSIAGSAWLDLRHGAIRRGASTITMQLERLRHPRSRCWSSKLIEALRACQLERSCSKEAILAEYLDRAPFGANVIGAEAASWCWFGRPVRSLSLAQCALLAGLPQSPTRLRPDHHPRAARMRRDTVLLAMRQQGLITEAAYTIARSEAVDARWQELPQEHEAGGAALASVLPSGQTGAIITTIDPATQALTYRLAQEQALDLGSDTALAVVVADNQGAGLRALVSVGGPADLDLTAIRRSPGSTLKPFVYAAAFDQGLVQPGSILADDPSAWQGFMPQNMDHTYIGDLTAAEALAESRNLPAMHLLQQIGIPTAGRLLEACGLEGLAQQSVQAGLDLAIGGCVVSPRDLAEAYATLARLGVHRRLSITPVVEGPGERVLGAHACLQVLDSLADQARTAACCPAAAAAVVAWKTGTSSGCRDAWCAACSVRCTVVVWCGCIRDSGDPDLTGLTAAAPLALTVIETIDHPRVGWSGGTTSSTVVHEFTKGPLESPDPQRTTTSVLAADLVVFEPTMGEHLCPDPDRPQAGVMLHLLAHGTPGATLWWFDDDRPVAQALVGETVSLPVACGVHHLHVIDAQGGSATCQVEVDPVETEMGALR